MVDTGRTAAFYMNDVILIGLVGNVRPRPYVIMGKFSRAGFPNRWLCPHPSAEPGRRSGRQYRSWVAPVQLYQLGECDRLDFAGGGDRSEAARQKRPRLLQGGAQVWEERRSAAEPNLRRLEGDLRRPHLNFALGDRTDGMVDDDRNQAPHTDSNTGQFHFAFEFGRDDRC